MDDSGTAVRLQRLLDLTPAMTGEFELPAALRLVVDVAREVLGCGSAVLVVRDHAGADAYSVVSGTVPAAVSRPPEASIDFPVQTVGGSSGLLRLTDPCTSDGFDDTDRVVGTLLAATASACLSRSEYAADNALRQRWLAESIALTRDLLAETESDALQMIVDRLRELSDADSVVVVHPGAESNTLVVDVHSGGRRTIGRGTVLTRTGRLTEQVMSEFQPMLIRRADEAGMAEHIRAMNDVESMVIVPLSPVAANRGALSIARQVGRRPFQPIDVDLVSMFAAQVVLALEQAERHVSREQRTLIDERDRIARDLHDHVIQQLFAVGLSLQAVAATIPAGASERVGAAVDDLDGAINRIRATIHRLTAPIASSRSFLRVRAVELVDDLAPVLGFRPSLDLRGPLDFGIDPDVLDDCVAVLREALSNVARHAQATRVDIAIAAEPATLRIVVEDDGRGVGEVGRRSGLANLRARAEARGGSMLLGDGPDGRGTCLEWSIPIGADGKPVQGSALLAT